MNEELHVQEQKILATLGEALLSSLDQDETLERISRTVTDHIADLCVVTMAAASGSPTSGP